MCGWLPLVCPEYGTWPATQACALTGNRTSNTLVCRPALNPLSHTSQGLLILFYLHHSTEMEHVSPLNLLCFLQNHMFSQNLPNLSVSLYTVRLCGNNIHVGRNLSVYPKLESKFPLTKCSSQTFLSYKDV